MFQICLLSARIWRPLKIELIELTHAIMVASGIPHTTSNLGCDTYICDMYIRIQLTLEKKYHTMLFCLFVCLPLLFFLWTCHNSVIYYPLNAKSEKGNLKVSINHSNVLVKFRLNWLSGFFSPRFKYTEKTSLPTYTTDICTVYVIVRVWFCFRPSHTINEYINTCVICSRRFGKYLRSI